MSLSLNPFQLLIDLVTVVLAGANQLLARFLEPGPAWFGAVVLLVLAVRIGLLPLALRQLRLQHASVNAAPELKAIRERYRGKNDPDSLRARTAATRAVSAEHGLSATGSLVLLLQLPVMFALFRVLQQVSQQHTVGQLSLSLVTAAGLATVLGVGLGATVRTASGPALAVVVVLIVVNALVAYLTQRYLVLPGTAASAFEPPLGQVQRLMPVVAGVGALVSGFVLPAGVLVYLVVSGLFTAGWQAAVNRWRPVPTSTAAARG